jgi:hypothetical protein
MPPTLFVLLIFFPLGSLIYAQASLDHDPPIYTSCVTGITDMYHHTQFYWLRWGLAKLFAPHSLEPQSSQSLLLE